MDKFKDEMEIGDALVVYDEDGGGEIIVSDRYIMEDSIYSGSLLLVGIDLELESKIALSFNREAVSEMVKYMQDWLNTGESNG